MRRELLEVRYNTLTRELTGWCGDEKQFGNLKDRGNEAIVILDISIPEKPVETYLMKADLSGLEDNPAYVPPVDWQAEWDKATPGDKVKVVARRLGIKP